MKSWERLLEVSKVLLGPKGCPWDKEQTLKSLQPYILEEAHELIEAIDSQDVAKIREELGDFLYTAVFVANIAQANGLFSISDSLTDVAEKLIRRHPHIFGDVEVKSSIDVMRNWEEIKLKEGRKHLFEGTPPTLPSLARAQKIVIKLCRKSTMQRESVPVLTEEQLGEKFFDLVKQSEFLGLDAESVLRRFCQNLEKKHIE